jgi:hypothetical protein
MCQEVIMKNRRVLKVLGITCILTLLFVILPVLPALAANTISVTPDHGVIGEEITVHGEFTITLQERWAIIYMAASDLDIGALITSAPSYKKVVNAVYIPPTGTLNPGIFNAHFDVPATLIDGSTDIDVTPGSYFIFATIMGPSGESGIAAKATFTVSEPVNPVFNPLNPATGPVGTSVTVSGTNFPDSTPLVIKFDTTTLTPTSGDTSTSSAGSFSSVVVVPLTASVGAHTIYVTCGAVSVNATFTVTTLTATITLSATSGTAGSSITVSGVNFTPSTALTIRFDAQVLTPTSGSTETSGTGTFSSVITIPSSASTGAHTIMAAAGASTDSETYTVTGGGIIPLTITPNNGPVGQSVTISGSGFTAGDILTVTWDGAVTTTTSTALTGGAFAIVYTIPAAIHGPHTIGVVHDTNTASGTFTIESTPPATPQPLRPYMDESVSSPITFDWDDVTDPSAPVTYMLQISTSANFTSNIINLTGLTVSQYTLTEADLLNFTTGVTYYWREKAVDAAQNESAWTGAGAFTISEGFSFIGWPLYLTVSLAAVLLFMFGIWLGRKTAYTY